MIVLAWVAIIGLVWAPFFWCCAPPTCETVVTVTVRGCNNSLVPGVTVELKNGATVLDSGTTNGSGVVVLSATTTYPLSATVSVAAQCGYALKTESVTLNCSPISTTVTLTTDLNHVCHPCCNWPIPLELTLGTPLGDVTMTYTGSNTWQGTISIGVPQAGFTFESCSCAGGGTGTCFLMTSRTTTTQTFTIDFFCDGFGDWRVSVGACLWYGRTACSGSPDWGFRPQPYSTCLTSDGTYGVIGYVAVGDEAVMTGTCSCGVFALSGTSSGLDSIVVEGEMYQQCCGSPGPPPANGDLFPTWGLTGTWTLDG